MNVEEQAAAIPQLHRGTFRNRTATEFGARRPFLPSLAPIERAGRIVNRILPALGPFDVAEQHRDTRTTLKQIRPRHARSDHSLGTELDGKRGRGKISRRQRRSNKTTRKRAAAKAHSGSVFEMAALR
jgi:hypothetical protein